MAPAPRPRRPARLRAIKFIAAILIGLLVLPYLLAPLYLFGRPVSTLMLARWATGARVERVWVPLDAMAASLPAAVIAAEDARFCRHPGLDLAEIRDAIEDAETLGDVRGASTLSQQTAKNLFLWPGRSFLRKLLEAPLALWLDLVLGKRRLLEIYLNIAEWGPNGEFGAEAAARRSFGKSARNLSPREAAMLAAALPAPTRRDPGRPGRALRRLAGIYERRAAVAQLTACLAVRPRP
ncbi:MAG TPA: monofunctional biosynthetic peptidoglycan transglycosylase [Rhodoplanes sp.]|nr:monofunctional biosynthetic peptidoglycan transglycosylase [Rhodoplanes sp.]